MSDLTDARDHARKKKITKSPVENVAVKLLGTGGHSWYNGHYDCYTLYLKCENCGDYEVECV